MSHGHEVSRILRDFAAREAFEIAWSKPSGEIGLTRPSPEDGLFEQVWADLAGSKRDAVTTYAAASVVWGRGTKGLVELEVVQELATVPRRGYARIETLDEVDRWAQALPVYVPRRTRILIQAKGSILLERTQAARQSAKALVAGLPESAGFDETRRWVAARATDEDRRSALRLAESPGVVASEHERELCEVAAQIIVCAAKVSPEAREVLSANLLIEQQAMWRVQLLVDFLRRKRTREGAKALASS